jgi:Phosphotransferase System HPr (HPr) Family
MLSKKMKVNNNVGLHARPVSVIAAEAQKFTANISLRFGEETVSAKSSVKLLSLCVGAGKYVELICDGPDERTAMEQLIKVFKNINDEN